MQANIAELVHPVFDRVLNLRDRLAAGNAPHWDDERAALRELLDAIRPADARPEAFDLSEQETPGEEQRLTLATIRYALTCWLDEFLCRHSAWGRRWREAPLEAELYGGVQDRRKFWDEARYAETRHDRAALEVILWCVGLGFAGVWQGRAETLQAWRERVQSLLDRTAPVWTMPASLTPPMHERPLPTDLPTRRLAFVLLLGFSLAAPLLAIWLTRW